MDHPIDLATVNVGLAGIRRYVVDTAELDRTDCLWPADYLVFATNPLSVAYGACGTALFLSDHEQGVPDPILAWIRRQPISLETYPPGLFVGMAGIAFAFLRCGLMAEASTILEQAMGSKLLYAEPGVFLGVAGWGLVCLQMQKATGDHYWVEHAERAADHLSRTANRAEVGSFWVTNLDKETHLGYGYGSSGIGLFLTQLYLQTGERKWADLALDAIDFDLNNAVPTGVGRQWRHHLDGSIVYPYWIHGTAGVGSVLVRCAELLDRQEWLTTAQELAEEAFVVHSVVPGQFIGLAGIGEFMLDVYAATGRTQFYDSALQIAESVLRFGIDRPEGLAFPGRSLSKISNDYGTGSAGVGCFLARLSSGRAERYFFDSCR
jgi:lantibiotic modifying enzyme